MKRQKREHTTGIYKITNIKNGKVYIGQSVDIERRWMTHKIHTKKENGKKFPIHHSLKKYWFENFSFEIIEECGVEVINEREQYYISFYNSMLPNGYNCDSGGKSGGYLSQERIDKMSGVESSLSTRIKMSDNQKGGKKQQS